MTEHTLSSSLVSLDSAISTASGRLSCIRNHPLYVSSYQKLHVLEEERIFCRHQMEHLLDVARIAYIMNLEMRLGISRDMIYAAALLHDIGKGRQYEEDIPHETASAEIAEQILSDLPPDLAFSTEELRQILTAIRGHRRLRPTPEPLELLLYKSDKMSRSCFSCPAEQECNWSDEKKNKEIQL